MAGNDDAIDKLLIDIDASSEGADKALDQLSGKLSTLESAVGSLDSNKLKALDNSLKSLSGVAEKLAATPGFSQLVDGISQLSSINTGKIDAISNSLNNFESVANKVSNVNVKSPKVTTVKADDSIGGTNAKASEISGEENSLTDAVNKTNESLDKQSKSAETASSGMSKFASSLGIVGRAFAISGLRDVGTMFSRIGTGIKSFEESAKGASTGLSGAASIIGKFGSVGVIISSVGTAAVSISKKLIGLGTDGIKSVISFHDKASEVLESIASKAWSVSGSIASAVKRAFGGVSGVFDDIGDKIHTVLKLSVYMALRTIIRGIFDEVKTGFENLALYSYRTGTAFNQNVSLMINDLHQLGNSIVTVAEPLVNALAPAIDFITQKFLQATNAAAQFFSALTGSKTYTVATKLTDNYGKSLDDAAKKQKRLTTGLDEMNIISEEQSQASIKVDGGGFDTKEVESKFQNLADKVKAAWKAADFTDIGRSFGLKLNEGLENIPWDKINKTLDNIAKSTATLLNGFFETPGLFSNIGKTLGNAVNTAFGTVDTFCQNFHWKSVGKAIDDFADSFCDTLKWNRIYKTAHDLAQGITDTINETVSRPDVWGKVGTTVGNGFNTAFEFAHSAVMNLHWGDLGTSIGAFISDGLNGIKWSELGDTIARGINGIATTIDNCVKRIHWVELAVNMSNGVNTMLHGIDHEKISQSVNDAFSGMGQFVEKAIETIDWKAAGEALMDSFLLIIEGLASFAKQINPEKLGQAIADFINSAAQTLMGDGNRLGKALGAINSAIYKTIREAVKDIDWEKLQKDIENTIDAAHVDQLVAGIVEFAIKAGIVLLKAGGKIFKEIVKGVWDGLVNAFKDSSPKEQQNAIGDMIIAGLGVGVLIALKAGNPLVAAILAVVGIVIATFKKGFDINSPSKKMIEIGKYVTEGFIKGFVDNTKTVISSVTTFVGNILKAFTDLINVKKFTSIAGDAITGFKDGIASMYSTVRDNIDTWAKDVHEHFTGIGRVNKDTFGNYGHDIIAGFNDKIKDKFSECQSNMETWGNSVIKWFTDKCHANDFTDHARKLTESFRDSIKDNFSTCQNKVEEWGSNIMSWFKNKCDISNFKNHANAVISNFNNGITEKYNDCRSAFENWGNSVKTWFTDKVHPDDFKNHAQTVVQRFNTGIENNWNNSHTTITNWAGNIKAWFSNETQMDGAAQNIVAGFGNGIQGHGGECLNAVRNWANSIKDTFQNMFDMHSPSRIFQKFAAFVVQGFNGGIISNADTSKSAMQTWADKIGDMNINLGMNVDDSALKNYKTNYGADFTKDAVIGDIRSNITAMGTVQVDSQHTKEAFKEAIKEAFPELSDMVKEGVKYAKISAEKDVKTNVYVGNRHITDAVVEQRKADGYAFT